MTQSSKHLPITDDALLPFAWKRAFDILKMRNCEKGIYAAFEFARMKRACVFQANEDAT